MDTRRIVPSTIASRLDSTGGWRLAFWRRNCTRTISSRLYTIITRLRLFPTGLLRSQTGSLSAEEGRWIDVHCLRPDGSCADVSRATMMRNPWHRLLPHSPHPWRARPAIPRRKPAGGHALVEPRTVAHPHHQLRTGRNRAQASLEQRLPYSRNHRPDMAIDRKPTHPPRRDTRTTNAEWTAYRDELDQLLIPFCALCDGAGLSYRTIRRHPHEDWERYQLAGMRFTSDRDFNTIPITKYGISSAASHRGDLHELPQRRELGR